MKKQLIVAAFIAAVLVGNVEANFFNPPSSAIYNTVTAVQGPFRAVPVQQSGLVVTKNNTNVVNAHPVIDGSEMVARSYPFHSFDSLRFEGADAYVVVGNTNSYMVQLRGRLQDLDAMKIAQDGTQLTVKPAASSYAIQQGGHGVAATVVTSGSSISVSSSGAGNASISFSSITSTGNSSATYINGSFISALQKVKARILMPRLTCLDASHSSKVVVTGSPIQTKKFKVETSFSSDVDVQNQLNADVVEADASHSGSVRLHGVCAYLKAKAGFSAAINAQRLIAQRAHADASFSSTVNVHATEELQAEASMSGQVNYFGNPKRVREKDWVIN